jgi:citrate lyase beta subunit
MKNGDFVLRRTYFEAPIMVERKWSKVPDIPADVFFADMEDSCPPADKERARERVVALVRDPAYFGGREFMCRPNNLSTPWGPGDLEALAAARAPFIVYPKLRSCDELEQVVAAFERHGTVPEIMVLIETPQAVLALEQVARCRGVSTLAFGPGDLSAAAGISNFRGARPFPEAFHYARSKLVMVACAYGLRAVDAAYLPDLRDMSALDEAAEVSRLSGFSGMITFYPPQVPVINRQFSPSASDVEVARRTVAAYEEGLTRGLAAVTVDGRSVTVHEYGLAKGVMHTSAMIGK